jgi:hypothetical protein
MRGSSDSSCPSISPACGEALNGEPASETTRVAMQGRSDGHQF